MFVNSSAAAMAAAVQAHAQAQRQQQQQQHQGQSTIAGMAGANPALPQQQVSYIHCGILSVCKCLACIVYMYFSFYTKCITYV